MRFLSFLGGFLIGGILFLVLGLALGMDVGQMNAEIDFCTDVSSARYISDETLRAMSCP